jgi:hypothetical protein
MVFRLPLLIVEQIVLKTPKTRALPAEDIARLQAVAQEPIDQKFITVGAQAFVTLGICRIQVAFERLPDTADRELLHRILAEWLASLPGRGEKVDGIQHRMAGGGRTETDS